MSRRRKGRPVDGILLLDKPAGLSSNQALQRVKRLYQARKAGHTGSLDPFATGLLPICFGEATKLSHLLLDADKTYLAGLQLGRQTETGDIEGDVIQSAPIPPLSTADIQRVFDRFIGPQTQTPPMYSALKHQGQPLYKLARQGKVVDRPPRRIQIHALELLNWSEAVIQFRVRCSKGTYVRTLAEDLATALGSCGHLLSLRRIESGPFRPEIAGGSLSGQKLYDLEQLEGLDPTALDLCLLPLEAAIPDLPAIRLDAAQAQAIANGQVISPPMPDGPDYSPDALLRLHAPGGTLLALAVVSGDGRLKPKRLFPGLVHEFDDG